MPGVENRRSLQDMKCWLRHDGIHGDGSQCAHCGRPIVSVPEVGWVDEHQPGTYDMCEANSSANHDPAPPAPPSPAAPSAPSP